MKKKIFGALVIVAIAVGAMINVNLNITSSKYSKNLDVILSTVEKVANAELIPVLKVYNKVSSDCPPPVQYKKSVSCPSGNTDETCSASDC